MTDAAAYIDDAQRIRELGWTAYKIHPPRAWKDDIAVCEAVRKAVGDDYMLMLDFDLDLRLHGGGARRPGDRRDGLLLV